MLKTYITQLRTGDVKIQGASLFRIALVLYCLLLVLNINGQTCLNPGARLTRLSATEVTKESLYQRVKHDLEFIQPGQHDTIADIGSYDGYYPSVYSIFSDSAVFYLNDVTTDGFIFLDSIQVLCARLKGQDLSNKFTVVIGQDITTNLSSHQFNKVVLRDALHHFKSMDIMLDDIKRIMKPDAKLILFEPIRGRNSNPETLCRGAMTIEELMSLLEKSGFRLTRELPLTVGGSWFEFEQMND